MGCGRKEILVSSWDFRRRAPVGAAAMPEVIINGPEGRLEGRYHHSKQDERAGRAAAASASRSTAAP